MASTLNLNVPTIPDGTYMVVLDAVDGTRLTRESVTFSGGTATVVLASASVGDVVKGYVDDMLTVSVDAAYLEGTTV